MENKNQKLRIKGQEFAKQVLENFGTNDVFVIAESAGVKIIYQSWFPVTIGEFDRKNRLICVNLNAKKQREKIIAHELGHFFAQELDLNEAEEESFCHEFARSFTEILSEVFGESAKEHKEKQNCKL